MLTKIMLVRIKLWYTLINPCAQEGVAKDPREWYLPSVADPFN